MTVAVQRLNENARAELVAHFLALPAVDRRLRFGSSLSPESVAAYVDKIDFDRDAVFAVLDDRLALVGVAHVAFGDELAELGLSVLPAHRGHGVGGALFERAAVHARNRFVPRIFMHCLEENAPIMHIARRFGMDIVTDQGACRGMGAHQRRAARRSTSVGARSGLYGTVLGVTAHSHATAGKA